jgi:hypothetical protein
LDRLCKDCKWRQHPEWAMLLPGFMICVNDNAGEVKRLDIQRTCKGDAYCGTEGKWWEKKQ